MRPRKTVSRNDRKRTNRPGKKQGKTRTAGWKAGRQTLPNHEARMRGFAAINGVRKGKYKSLSAGALAEGTTVQSIKRLLPEALLPSRPGKAIRVRASDRYTQLVEILDNSGEVVQVLAHGSNERNLAGLHRAAYLAVLGNKQPSSILRRFRGKRVGGRKLLTNPERLFELARGGVVDDLSELYVPPDSNP
jgi:hypothetical protein